MRRVLVVAYYFPPMGLSGVQRVAKWVKYLPHFGWEPTVLTVQPRGYFAFDPTLLGEVEAAGIRIVRTRSLDPTRLYAGGERVEMPDEGSRRMLSVLSQALFVPDNKIGWYWPAVRAGARLHAGVPFDAVLSSAPPYTGHLVGARISRRIGRPLIADFRDDWLGNPRHTYPTRWHRATHAALERAVLRQASCITAINPVIARELASRHPELPSDRIRVLEQGFDPEDYPPTRDPRPPGSATRIVYTGIFYDAQTPAPFLEGLARFRALHPDRAIEAHFHGLFPARERERVTRLGLEDVVRIGPYLDHRDAMTEVARADAAWLTVGRREGAEQISTGKLYAYAGAGVPILGLVPDGAARDALVEYGASVLAPPDDPVAIAEAIREMVEGTAAGTLPKPNPAFQERHNRIGIAGRLAEMLDGLTTA